MLSVLLIFCRQHYHLGHIIIEVDTLKANQKGVKVVISYLLSSILTHINIDSFSTLSLSGRVIAQLAAFLLIDKTLLQPLLSIPVIIHQGIGPVSTAIAVSAITKVSSKIAIQTIKVKATSQGKVIIISERRTQESGSSIIIPAISIVLIIIISIVVLIIILSVSGIIIALIIQLIIQLSRIVHPGGGRTSYLYCYKTLPQY